MLKEDGFPDGSYALCAVQVQQQFLVDWTIILDRLLALGTAGRAKAIAHHSAEESAGAATGWINTAGIAEEIQEGLLHGLGRAGFRA